MTDDCCLSTSQFYLFSHLNKNWFVCWLVNYFCFTTRMGRTNDNELIKARHKREFALAFKSQWQRFCAISRKHFHVHSMKFYRARSLPEDENNSVIIRVIFIKRQTIPGELGSLKINASWSKQQLRSMQIQTLTWTECRWRKIKLRCKYRSSAFNRFPNKSEFKIKAGEMK